MRFYTPLEFYYHRQILKLCTHYETRGTQTEHTRHQEPKCESIRILLLTSGSIFSFGKVIIFYFRHACISSWFDFLCKTRIGYSALLTLKFEQ